MTIKKSAVAVALLLGVAGVAYAGDCVLHITRTACAGKEKESFSKCNGNASCDETKSAISASQCASKAKSACENHRKDITKYKKITASYDGSDVDGGKDFCVGHPDYPYANKPACKD